MDQSIKTSCFYTSSSSSTRTPNQLEIKGELENKIKLIEANLKRLRATTTTVSLSEHNFEQLSLNYLHFRQVELNDFTQPCFDNFSIYLIQKLNSCEGIDRYRELFSRIFNHLFNSPQLNRHLNNMLTYVHLVGVDKQKKQNTIKNQISLLTTDTIMKAAYCSDGLEEGDGRELFWLSLTHVNEDIQQLPEKQTTNTLSGNFFGTLGNLATEDIKNQIIAAEMLSTQTPTSLFEASSTRGMYMQQYEVFASMLPNEAKPAAIIFPTLISILRKLYLRHYRTTPIAVPYLTEYGNQFSSSRFFTGREEVFERILAIWNQGKHPILVGPPGTGKTSILMELGCRIANKALPNFKGEILYAGSGAKLCGQNMMGPAPFESVIKTLQPYSEQVVLAIDEAQALAEKPANLAMLRSVTDQSHEHLRHCLFVTTPDGYAEHFEKDESLRRRLVKIELTSLGQTELMHLLHWEAKKISPYLTIGEEAMKRLYEKVDGNQNESRMLLHKVLVLAEKKCSGNLDDLTKQRDLKLAEVELHNFNHINQNIPLKEKLEKLREMKAKKLELENLNKELEGKRKTSEKHKEHLNRLILNEMKRIKNSKKIVDGISQYKRSTTIINDESLLKDNNFTEKYKREIKKVLFLQFFQIPHQMETIMEFEKSHGFFSEIDETMMLDLLAEIS